MSLCRLLAAAAVGLAVSSPALAQDGMAPAKLKSEAAPADAVSSAIAAYEAAVKDVPLTGENYEKYRQAANVALASLAIDTLTIDDIERLSEKMLVGRAFPETQKRVDERLGALAKAPDVDGARAAMLRTTINTLPTDTEELWKAYAAEDKNRLMTVMTHPGLPKALEAGKTKYLFVSGSISGELADDAYASALTKVIAMPLPADVVPRLWSMYTPIAETKSTASRETREKLRLACVEKVKAARADVGGSGGGGATSEADKVRKQLDDRLKSLEGAYAKGQLVGQAAPEIEFLWTDVPGGAKKLSDLKGKVVVVDFWAVWCGPCVGSFPQVRELQARYKDYPVVILGITDMPGTPPPTTDMGPPSQWKGEVQFPALAAWAKEKDVTWPLAVALQSVFNPDYGIRGIPHVVILDPDGKVRYRGLHPASEPEKKHEYIDGLLKEFKLPSPGA